MSDEELDYSRGNATKIAYVDGRPTTITLRKCKLVVARGGILTEHTFEKDVITIGAMDDNDVVLDDDTVSRNHCTIALEGDTYILNDNDSTNGTYINRVRIRSAYLTPNQVITLGSTEIRFSPIDERVRIVPSERDRFGEVIGRDRRMREIYAILEKIAPTDATVVIEGETGTGKEVVAQTVHGQSRRAETAVCGLRLFGGAGQSDRVGALRSREGLVHRRDHGAPRALRDGARRHDLPRRAGRAEPRPSAEAAAGARDARGAPGGRGAAGQGRRAGDRGDQSAARRRGAGGALSRGPVLSAERGAACACRRCASGATIFRCWCGTSCDNGSLQQGRGWRAAGEHARALAVLEALREYDWPGNVRELHNVIERAVQLRRHRHDRADRPAAASPDRVGASCSGCISFGRRSCRSRPMAPRRYRAVQGRQGEVGRVV
jgi:hypothetical protein